MSKSTLGGASYWLVLGAFAVYFIVLVVEATDAHFCKADTACTIHTTFYDDASPKDIQDTITFANVDAFFGCDGATAVTGAIVTTDVVDNGSYFDITFSASDLTDVEECTLNLIDQTATKTFMDKSILITTFGDAGARVSGIPTFAIPGDATAIDGNTVEIEGNTAVLEQHRAALGMFGANIDTVDSQTQFDLDNGPAAADLLNNTFTIVVLDASDSNEPACHRRITDWIVTTQQVVIDSACGFTVAQNDDVIIMPNTLGAALLAAADVNSEVDIALADLQLDCLMADDTDNCTVANDSALARIAASDTPATWASYTNTTDSQEAIRDSSAQASVATEARLAELDAANLPTDVAANASPAEVATELATYDGPTNAEMEARTLVAASYFDPAADTVATVTSVTSDVTLGADEVDADALKADAVDEIWAEVLTELSQGAPSATPSVRDAVMLLYMALRNELTVNDTAGCKTFSNDAGTVIFKKCFTDDGSIYTETEAETGP